MATHKSAEKRARQSIKKSARNMRTLGSVRTLEKRVRTTMATGDKAQAETLVKEYMSKMGKAIAKGVVHTRTGSRKIARLTARVAAMGKAPAAKHA